MKNPFPPRMPPNFVPYKAAFGDLQEDLYRGLAIWRGHEYIVIRKEDLTPGDGLRAGDFGISSDTWVFSIRDSAHAAVARVSSQALNGRLLDTPERVRESVYDIWKGKKRPGPQALRADLNFCTSYPTSEESVRHGTKGGECSFQIGEKCFPGESTVLGGDRIIKKINTVFMQGPPAWWTANDVRENLLAFPDIWEKLEMWFLEQRKSSKNAAVGLPRQCEHCHGSGTVPR